MRYLLIVLVFIIGVAQPIQAGMNSTFSRVAGHPFKATILNMWLGATAILLLAFVMGLRPPGPQVLRAAPTWSLFGGLIGASIVTVMLLSVSRLGAALMIAVFVCGQLLSSLVIDHNGLVGYPPRPVSTFRIVGVAMVLLGVLFVERAGATAVAAANGGGG